MFYGVHGYIKNRCALIYSSDIFYLTVLCQVSGLNVVTNKTISAHTLYLPALAHSLRLEQEQLQHIGVNPCRESVCSYLCLITPSRFRSLKTGMAQCKDELMVFSAKVGLSVKMN